ncbi:DUF1127 domain-containing protein [Shimia thalassica]|uniref:YjiS-like domain-containing protein n=2 Tax=Shimia thalassica TaxID=1715693 RepID=A0A0P1IFF7_9RHOB|nr:DUF1127 domain-containing protein [Shimia thalassica]PHO02145.1 DUF1127 domain-containing protein [Rhodobacteraceae bacterium 4F10]MBU2941866.1 DUF1127 domain-containing protein [Shimia thalassica]MDO6481982.1 DUF1127 domain-containing protein [Shimia thalassica]MDO6485998.1 DUF1127 domain-containing protein [Shimia thalassica]MDO6505205.1 DUF1127 domain-containing protein [Shimia thalassica]
MALVSEYSSAKNGSADRMVAMFAGLGERFRKARLYNQTYRELNNLSTAELKDLGLHRSMIRRMAYQAAYGN